MVMTKHSTAVQFYGRIFKMNITLTHDEIRRASTAKLRNILKEDIDVELDDMINYELYIREFS